MNEFVAEAGCVCVCILSSIEALLNVFVISARFLPCVAYDILPVLSSMLCWVLLATKS